MQQLFTTKKYEFSHRSFFQYVKLNKLSKGGIMKDYTYSDSLLKDTSIKLKYHYHLIGYLKLIAGGTATPTSIDIIRKSDKKFIRKIKRQEILDQLADS